MSVWLLVRVCLLVWAILFGSVLAQSPRTGGGITPIDPKTGIKGGIQAVTPKESKQEKPTATQPNRPIVKHPTANPSDFGFRFTENKGQWGKNVSYRVQLPDGKLSLEKNRFIYDLVNDEDLHKLHEASHGHSHDVQAKKAKKEEPVKVRSHVFSVSFEGANANPTLSALDRYSDYENYFVGNDPSQWASGVYSYKVVKYRGLYNGIDLKMYTHEKNIKYDFIVAPGSSPEQIRMKYSGANKIYLSKGALKIKTSVKELTEYIPLAYQEKNGQRLTVACTYKIVSDSIVTFELPEGYDRSLPLVIDPTLVYATYSGERSICLAYSATYDKDGNLYTAGKTTVIVKVNPNPILNVNNEILVIKKFDTNPRSNPQNQGRLMYTIYIDSKCEQHEPRSLICNKNGDLYILAVVNRHSNVPKKYYQPNSNPADLSGLDIVIYKLRNSDGELVKAFVWGGEGDDGKGITLWRGESGIGEIILDDKEENVYVATGTNSNVIDGIPGSNALSIESCNNPQLNVTFDGVIVKIPTDLSAIVWGTFIGGCDDDDCRGIRLSEDGTIYVCGTTESNNFLNATAQHDNSLTGQRDGFVLSIKNNIQKYTYVGGSGEDRSSLLDLDSDNNVYIVGQIYQYVPTDPNRFNIVANGQGIYQLGSNITGGKQYIRKYSSDLSQLIFSSVWGTNPNNQPNIDIKAFLVDRCENLYVYGWGGYVNGSTFGLQSFGIQNNNGRANTDGSDMYLISLSRNAEQLLLATFMGVFYTDDVNNMQDDGIKDHCHDGMSRFDKNGILYIAGCVPTGINPVNNQRVPDAVVTRQEGLHYAAAFSTFQQQTSELLVDLYSVKFDAEILLPQPDLELVSTSLISPCSKSVIVSFRNLTRNPPQDRQVIYEWDFGDESEILTTTDPSPTHIYKQTGDYMVTLKIRDINMQDGDCNVNETTEKVTVSKPPGNGSLLTLANLEGSLFCLGNWKANLKSVCTYQHYWLQVSDVNGNFPAVPTPPLPPNIPTNGLTLETHGLLALGPQGPTDRGAFNPDSQPYKDLIPEGNDCKLKFKVRPIAYRLVDNKWEVTIGDSFPVNQ